MWVCFWQPEQQGAPGADPVNSAGIIQPAGGFKVCVPSGWVVSNSGNKWMNSDLFCILFWIFRKQFKADVGSGMLKEEWTVLTSTGFEAQAKRKRILVPFWLTQRTPHISREDLFLQLWWRYLNFSLFQKSMWHYHKRDNEPSSHFVELPSLPAVISFKGLLHIMFFFLSKVRLKASVKQLTYTRRANFEKIICCD